MTPKSLSLALATTLLLALTPPTLAEDKSGSNLNPAASAGTAGGVATMALAQDLYALGVVQGDALTVLAAAKMAASVSVIEAEAAILDPTKIAVAEADPDAQRKAVAATLTVPPTIPTPTPRGAIRTAAKASFLTATGADQDIANAPPTAEAMFAKATDLAAGDETILDVIENTKAESWQVQVGGAVRWPSTLSAGQADVWEIPFYADANAEIAVIGDGDADLDVAIRDENGNIICQEVSGSDRLSCDFTPAWDGYFYVTVQNLGNLGSSYHVMTN